MRTTQSILATMLLLLSATPTAHAGGLGLISQFGTHQERAYYYSTGSGEQAVDSQTRTNYGTGLEGLLGDRDDKIQGLLRMSWSADSAAKAPDTDGAANVEYPAVDKQGTRHVGTLALGIQWGVLGDPSEMQLVINSLIGSGFITVDNTEYMLLETGVGGTYNFTSEIQAVANLDLIARHRKRFTFGPAINLGIRYMFD
jgi:hypothetical protein